MSRIDSLLRFMAMWPKGRLRLVMYVDRGLVVASAIDVDNTRVFGPVQKPTVDESVVELMQQALDTMSKNEGHRP